MTATVITAGFTMSKALIAMPIQMTEVAKVLLLATSFSITAKQFVRSPTSHIGVTTLLCVLTTANAAGTLDDIEFCLGAVGGGGVAREEEVWSLVRHLRRRDMMVLLRAHGVMKKVVDIIIHCPGKDQATAFAICCLACLLFKDLR